MKTLNRARPALPMVLNAMSATDLMTPNPLSIHRSATVSEAATFLARRGISAAPVIDEAGRPVGVVSSTDILIHVGQGAAYRAGALNRDARPEWPAFSEGGPCSEVASHFTVAEVMTPGVFCVRPETPAGMV